MNKKKTMIASMIGCVLATSIIVNAQENNNSDIKVQKDEVVMSPSIKEFEREQDVLLKEQKRIAFEEKKALDLERIAEKKRLDEEKKVRELKLAKQKAEKEARLKAEKEAMAKKNEEEKVKVATAKNVTKTQTKQTIKNDSFFVEGINMPYEHQKYLYELTQKRGLDYLETLAFIGVESTYRANAQGGSNYGYFQINKINHAHLSNKLGTNQDAFDPYTNINWGTYMIADLLKKYNDWNSVLSAYNKGEGGFKNTGYATGYIQKYNKTLAGLRG